MKHRVIVLGSTGSIGTSALDVLEALSDRWSVVGLAAGSRSRELFDQARRFRPEAVALVNGETESSEIAEFAPDCRTFRGTDALTKLVESVPCDCVVSAVVGVGGLAATIRAVELGRRVALANKEAMVIAGAILMPLAERMGAELIPIDSEHSAVFQALHAGSPGDVHRVYLTASGGPFREWTAERMATATLEDALRHPTWDMGPKISIDSATMMNKALEIVEARWLFDLEPDQIEVIVHPEAIVHSFVEFNDGSVIAQLGSPDMRTPIQYALTYPDRLECRSDRIDFAAMLRLSFEPPDEQRFPALRLGHEVARRGGTSGAVLNAANETAVELFRAGAIGFSDIVSLVEQTLNDHEFVSAPSLDELLAADRWARQEVTRCTAC